MKGSEKVVIPQDKQCENKPLVIIRKDLSGEMYVVQVNSKSYKPHGITQIISIKSKNNILLVNVPILNELNVIILLRALGIESDRDIINYIAQDSADLDMIQLISNSLLECKSESGQPIRTQAEAIDYLINKMRVNKKYSDTNKTIRLQQKKIYLFSLLRTGFLPHIDSQAFTQSANLANVSNMPNAGDGLVNTVDGSVNAGDSAANNEHNLSVNLNDKINSNLANSDLIIKGIYICYMINRLLRCMLGRIPKDDRDSYTNKRIDLPGSLMEELFRQYYRKMLNDCNKFFKKRNQSDDEPINIINQIKPGTIEQGFKNALATGSWIRRKGVAQMLQRISYMYTISSLRRVDAPDGDAATSKLTGPRHLHPSSVRWLCCVQTPEHAKVGLTKHLSMIGSVTIMHSSQIYIIKSFVTKHIINILDISSSKIINFVKVFLNGDLLGLTDTPIQLYENLRKNKLSGLFEPRTGLVYDILENEIRIYCDGGRGYAPAIIVDSETNTLLLTQNHINSVSLNSKVLFK